MNAPSKRCSKCEQVKPLDAFHLCSASPDGRQYFCRECRAAYDKARAELLPLGQGPLEPEHITHLLTQWKPPVVSVRIVEVAMLKREAVG
jgi:hypothetical protein